MLTGMFWISLEALNQGSKTIQFDLECENVNYAFWNIIVKIDVVCKMLQDHEREVRMKTEEEKNKNETD